MKALPLSSIRFLDRACENQVKKGSTYLLIQLYNFIEIKINEKGTKKFMKIIKGEIKIFLMLKPD